MTLNNQNILQVNIICVKLYFYLLQILKLFIVSVLIKNADVSGEN